MCLELSTCLSSLIVVCAGNELCASLFNGLVVSAVYLVPLRWFGKVCGKHVMRPWESMALCQLVTLSQTSDILIPSYSIVVTMMVSFQHGVSCLHFASVVPLCV